MIRSLDFESWTQLHLEIPALKFTIGGMTATALRVRRATLDDLAKLRPLWASMHLPVADLEPRLREFQVVEDAKGVVLGGIGFQMGDRQARLHSEGYTDFAIADAARELLWNRIQTLAANHGIFRLWMHETIPFWSQTGFKPADAETLKRLPPSWNVENTTWFTLQLKDEEKIASLEKELAMFMEAEKQNSARVFQRAKVLKTLTTIIAVILVILVLGAAIYVLIRRPELSHQGR